MAQHNVAVTWGSLVLLEVEEINGKGVIRNRVIDYRKEKRRGRKKELRVGFRWKFPHCSRQVAIR